MKKPFWIVALVLTIELCVVLLLVPGDWTKKSIDKEAGYVQRSLGNQSVLWVHDKASTWYRSAILEPQVLEIMRDFLVPTEEQRAKSRGMENMGIPFFNWWSERIYAFGVLAYQVCVRLALVLMWAPYILILLVPALYDGHISRRIKRTNFDYASPVIQRYSSRGIGILVSGLLVLMFLPWPLDPIIVPLVMMISAVLMGVSVSNLQKRI